MIVPFEAKPFETIGPGPTRDRQIEIIDRLVEIREDNLPGFTVRAAGGDVQEALELVQPSLYVAGFDVAQTGITRAYTNNPDNPPHRNNPGRPGAPRAVNVIYCETGRAAGSILEVTEDFNHRSKTAAIPENTAALLLEGKVDDKVATPVCYQGEIDETDVFIHMMTGPNPHIHGFRSLARPRVFKVVTAWQAPRVRYSD